MRTLFGALGLTCTALFLSCFESASVPCGKDGVTCQPGWVCITERSACINPLDTLCGNGVTDEAAGEQCDDGNFDNGDDCNWNCRFPKCGDGFLRTDLGEVCDDGNGGSGDGCAADCGSLEICGDGVINTVTGEACDAGSFCTDLKTACQSAQDCVEIGDGSCGPRDVNCCTATCRNPFCGNSVVETNCAATHSDRILEVCDFGSQCENGQPCAKDTDCGEIGDKRCRARDNPNCSQTCLFANPCGDGIVNRAIGEVCDGGRFCSDQTDCVADADCLGKPGDQLCLPRNTLRCTADCRSEGICGDGIPNTVAPYFEVCDDGKHCGNGLRCTGNGDCTDGECIPRGDDGCSADCKATGRCGDGATDLGEACDDGNRVDGDGCSGDCRNRCGDGVLHASEGCDDGEDCGDGVCNGQTRACLVDCERARCGDLLVQAGVEDCDSGALDSEECNQDCTAASCGDGYRNVASGEDCDSRGLNTIDCNENCSYPRCGDNIINRAAGERCDDGNRDNLDGCSADCTSTEECGDTVTNFAVGEVCDKGSTCDSGGACESDSDCTVGEFCTPKSGSGCSKDCRSTEICGDGYVNSELQTPETCDDFNLDRGDGCSAACQTERGWACEPRGASPTSTSRCSVVCGDRIVVAGLEACDDGDNFANDGCSPVCQAEVGWSCPTADGIGGDCTPVCGDGLVRGGEPCDDANTLGGDGCSATCGVEVGWSCPAALKGRCQPVCGDGLVRGVETCDDLDASSLDGCSATCQVEIGWTCAVEGKDCAPICGDGIVRGGEACDDANTAVGDGCSSTCTAEAGWECPASLNGRCRAICGDSLVRGTEGCDDSNLRANDGCGVTCQPEAGWICPTAAGAGGACTADCGDGLARGTEQCDDANRVAGDGCSATCQREAGWACPQNASGTPIGGGCRGICGDGQVVGDETCDDLNASGSDGCDSGCKVEEGWTCPGTGGACTAICGDGKIVGPQTCDEGTSTPSGGCVACVRASGWTCVANQSCTSICGDGIKVGTEQCDNGTSNSNSALCTLNCVTATCTDGLQLTDGAGAETFTDCGGVNSCPRCANNLKCVNDSDCLSNYCNPGLFCATPLLNADTWTFNVASLNGSKQKTVPVLDLLLNDGSNGDIAADAIFTIKTQPACGTVAEAGGIVTFTDGNPAAQPAIITCPWGQTFTYEVCSPTSAVAQFCATAIVTVNVNHAPTLSFPDICLPLTTLSTTVNTSSTAVLLDPDGNPWGSFPTAPVFVSYDASPPGLPAKTATVTTAGPSITLTPDGGPAGGTYTVNVSACDNVVGMNVTDPLEHEACTATTPWVVKWQASLKLREFNDALPNPVLHDASIAFPLGEVTPNATTNSVVVGPAPGSAAVLVSKFANGPFKASDATTLGTCSYVGDTNLVLNGDERKITYAASATPGNDACYVQVCEPCGTLNLCNVMRIPLRVINSVIANSDTVNATEQQALPSTGTFAKNTLMANDLYNSAASFTLVGTPFGGGVATSCTGGKVVISGSDVVYTGGGSPVGACLLTDTFQYQVCSAEVPTNCSTSTVTIKINRFPVAVGDSAVATEDTALVIPASTLLGNDSDPNNVAVPGTDTLSITAVSAPSNGTVSLSGTSITFTPSTNSVAAGGFTYTLSDGKGLTATATVTVTITAVNDAPVLDISKSPVLTTVLEDNGVPSGAVGTLVSALVDFAGPLSNVVDPDGTPLGIAVIGATAANGTWHYSTNSGSNWQLLGAVSDSAARLLTADGATRLYFQGNANFNGTADITFRAWDLSAGAAGAAAVISSSGGSTAFSSASDTATITVTPVNDTPTANDDSITTLEDVPLVLSALTDFGTYADVENTAFSSVKIITLATNGALQFDSAGTQSWVAVTANQVVTVTDITAGKLRFAPDANENGTPYATLTFKVSEDATGTVLSVPTYTLTANVTSVNDAPAGTSNNTAATNEDVVFTFAAANFGFLDPSDTPVNTFSSVTITTLPVADGTLRLSGTPVIAGQVITVATIPNLTFTPDANLNGNDLGAFTFQVTDNGGVANGGQDTDQSANTFNFDVAPINDEPTLTATGGTPTFTEGGAPVDLFGTVAASTVDATQTLTTLVLTVGGVTNGTSERLTIAGTTINLLTTPSTALGNGMNYAVAISGNTATVTLSGGTLATGAMETLVDGMTYSNVSQDPTAGNRVVTLTRIDDSGPSTPAPNDNTTTLSIAATITVVPINDEPTLTATANNRTFTEGDAVTAALFSSAVASTVEAGQTITALEFTVANVANSTEQLAIDGGNIALVNGATGVTATNTLIFSVSVTAGTATVTLSKTAGLSVATVATVVNGVAYRNTSQDPTGPARVVSVTRIDDSGLAGAGGADNDNTRALSGISANVTVAPINDEPTLTATATNPSFTEGGAAADMFNAVTIDTIEAGQSLNALQLTVSNLSNGSAEVLTIAGVALPLVATPSTALGNGFNYVISVASNTATVTLSGGTLSVADMQTLIDGIAYSNTNLAATAGNRVVTLKRLDDDGATGAPNDNTVTVTIASTVTVVTVNNAPIIANLNNDALSFVSGTPLLDQPAAATVTDVDSVNFNGGSLTVTLSPVDPLDVLSVVPGGTVTVTGGNNVKVSNTSIGLATFDSGVLTIVFGSNSTPTSVGTVLTRIGFTTTATNLDTVPRTATFVLNDGDGGTSTGTVVNITDANDAPTFAATAVNATYTEDGSGADLFNAAAISAIEPSQTLTLLRLTVTNVTNGANEVINFDGTAIAVNDTNAGTTTTNSVAYAVSVSGSTATLTLTKSPGLSAATLISLVNAMTYANLSQAPTVAGNRVVTFTRIEDSGSNTAPSVNFLVPSITAANVTVVAQNDAPALDNTRTPALANIGEDAGAPVDGTQVGTPVSQLVDFVSGGSSLDNVTDPDTNPVLGLAVVGANATNGTWWFSINNGGAWTLLGTPTESAARPILVGTGATTGRLYFEANPSFNGGTVSPAITFRAWDSTSGTNGTVVNISSSGTTTAFSSATDTADLIVDGANDAPVLDDSKTPVLVTELEDAGAPTGAVGTPVTDLVDFTTGGSSLDNVSDADGGAVLGVAITASNTANGSWLFSLDATTWTAFPVVGATTSLLLPGTARVYFQPNANFSGLVASALTFRAWDTTSGTAGATANTSSNGNATAFSNTTDTADLTITAVNDAPVLTAATIDVTLTIVESVGAPVNDSGTSRTNSTLVSALVSNPGNVVDPDGPLLGIAITASTGNGTWWYSINNGETWILLGAVADNSARVILAGVAGAPGADTRGRLYFEPSTSNNGQTVNGITFRAWDQNGGSPANGSASNDTSGANNGGSTDYSTVTDTLGLTVNSENDTPVLNAGLTPVLDAQDEDSPAPTAASTGTLVSKLVDYVGGAAGVSNVTDDDTSPTLGMAIIETAGTGTWWYSTAATPSWTVFPALTSDKALTLFADTNTRIYFQPSVLDSNGNIASAIKFRAWDATNASPSNGGNPTVGTPGGISAYSSAFDTADLTINPVNDAPAATAGAAITYSKNEPAKVIDNTITITDIDSDNISGATVTITGNPNAEDVLAMATINGISASYANPTLTLTHTGTKTKADYVAALKTVTYFNATASSTLPRTVTWVVSDEGPLSSAAVTSTITINIPSVVTAGATLAYTEEQVATVIDNTITVTDADNANIASAKVTITANVLPEDVLSMVTANGISASWVSPVLTLTHPTGTKTKAEYEAALKTVLYVNTNAANPSTLARTVQWQVDDGNILSPTGVTSTITVTAVNDSPTANIVPASLGPWAVTTTQTLLPSILTVGDVDSGSSNITVTLSVIVGALNVTAGNSNVTPVGTGTDSLTLTGTISQIIALVTGTSTGTLTYTAPATVGSGDALDLHIDDGGNTGGGAATHLASDTVVINLSP